jgi:hypothetical protein
MTVAVCYLLFLFYLYILLFSEKYVLFKYLIITIGK